VEGAACEVVLFHVWQLGLAFIPHLRPFPRLSHGKGLVEIERLFDCRQSRFRGIFHLLFSRHDPPSMTQRQAGEIPE
jgi:hypothetical protein